MKKKILKIISSILGCFAICGFSLFGFLYSSNGKLQVNADSDLYTNSFNKTFDAQLYVKGNSSLTPTPWGESSFDWSIDLRYYLDSNNQYNVELSHRIDCGISPAWAVTYIGIDTFTNYFSPRENLTFQLMINYFSIENRSNSISIFSVNYTLSNYGTVFLTKDFTIQGSTFGTGDRTLMYGGEYYYVPLPNQVNTIVVPGDSIQFFNVEYVPSGYETGYTVGYSEGYQQGYDEGNTVGYGNGYNNGTNQGYSNGYDVGYQNGVDSQLIAIQNAYSQGYSEGYSVGHTEDSTVASIFSGILTVGMLPVNFFLQIFNFEILGINLSAFISAIFTVALTIIVIKTVTGKGGGGSDK